MATTLGLPELLDSLEADATLVQRHLWLIRLVAWVRGDCRAVTTSISRITLLLDALDQRPQTREIMQFWWRKLHDNVDLTALLADHGFASRSAFISEFLERLRLKLLPATPETADASVLFSLVFSDAFDAEWIAAMDGNLLARLSDLLQAPPARNRSDESLAPPLSDWHESLIDAITFCTSQIRATGFSHELRLRMSAPARDAKLFHALAADLEILHRAFLCNPDKASVECRQALEHFLQQLDACREAVESVYTHLDANGVSVSLVFQLRQLEARVVRIRTLLDCLFSNDRHAHTATLVAHLVTVAQERHSLRALIAANSSMLAAKVAERSSETGEHYITRTMPEYRAMLRQAAGGGAVMSVTTLIKFLVLSMGLSAFWGGFFAGMNYALSFVLVQLLHWTVATKQPAMTAPAMAAKLKDLSSPGAVERFVDEVTHLVRSQVAAIVGNLAVVAPCVLLISTALWFAIGKPMIDAATAEHVLHDLTLLGPTALFAAGTGVLLFVSSIIAGWVENWFVLRRLDSALRYNPNITATLGAARADRWASFMRNNISGLAANISLGLMLGLIPAIAAFFGLGLQVRHVTLSTGQLAAAAASLGTDIFSQDAFWWCLAGLVVSGLLNVGVSFYFAYRLALRAHNLSGIDRTHIRQAIRRRARTRPLSFLWPESTSNKATENTPDHARQ